MAISPDHQRITDLLVKDIERSGLTADEKNNLVTSLQGALESTTTGMTATRGWGILFMLLANIA